LIGLQWRTKEVMAQFSALAQRAWHATITSDDFWLDFCTVNFGSEIAAQAAPIFASVDGDAESVDGRALPVFTTCCPGAIKKANKVPWSVYSKQFEFVAALETLRPVINGTANLARYDYWLHTFGYLRSGGQLSCLLSNYTVANKAAMQIADPAQRMRALRTTVVPVRQAMVDVWEELTAHQLQAVTTRGAMGTIQNMEAITKPLLLDAPGAALSTALGGEAVPQPSMTYTGADRIFVPNLRTNVEASEALVVEAVVLSASPPVSVELVYRNLSGGGEGGAWSTAGFQLVTEGRGVYKIVSEPARTEGGGDPLGGGGDVLPLLYAEVVACGSPLAGPWRFLPSGGLALNATLCLESTTPIGAADCVGCPGGLVLKPCSASSPAWEVTSAPGFETIAVKGVSGACGPAALEGNVALGTPFDICSLLDTATGKGAYCDDHRSCDWVWNASSLEIVHPEHNQLCLGAGAKKPQPPPGPAPPPFGPCSNPLPPPPQPGPGTFRLGDITEYFVKAAFADATIATFPEGSFVGSIRDGDTLTVVAA
jgi:hypothetical protein